MNWYLIQTKQNAYTVAHDHLKRQGFEVFLPLTMKTAKYKGKFINKIVPLFPSYLFMGTEQNEIPWKSVNATRGVAKAVTLDGHYRVIAPEIIEGIKQRADESGLIQKMNNLVSGDRVKIERGPFADFICNIDKLADDQRAWVLIDILQQKTRARIMLKDLLRLT